MRQLLIKDLHTVAAALVVGCLCAIAPYLLNLALSASPDSAVRAPAKLLAASAEASLWSTLIAATFLGACVIGVDRGDGSERFLATLPLSWRLAVLSKLQVSLGVLAAIWAGNSVILYFAWVSMGRRASLPVRPPDACVPYAIGGAFSLFAIAWLVSSFSRSVHIPLMATILFAVAAYAGITGLRLPIEDGSTFLIASIVMGVACIAFGSWRTIRRRGRD